MASEPRPRPPAPRPTESSSCAASRRLRTSSCCPEIEWVVAGAYSGRGGINLIRASDRSTVFAYPAQTSLGAVRHENLRRLPGPPDAATKAKFQMHGISLRARRQLDPSAVRGPAWRPRVGGSVRGGCAPGDADRHLDRMRGRARSDRAQFSARAVGWRVRRDQLPGARRRPRHQSRDGRRQERRRWEWHTASGWHKVGGTEAAGANGIEMSQDERAVYVAAWGAQSLFRVSRGPGTPERRRGAARVPRRTTSGGRATDRSLSPARVSRQLRRSS